jgi:hypothetical protein
MMSFIKNDVVMLKHADSKHKVKTCKVQVLYL